MSPSTRYPTIGERLDAYQRWERQCDYVAGALGVLLVITGLAANALKVGSGVMLAILITLAVVAGASVGRARLGLSSAESVLRSDVEKTGSARTDNVPTDDKFKFPIVEYALMWCGLILLVLDGISLLIAVWWAAIAHQPEECSLKWDKTKHLIMCTTRDGDIDSSEGTTTTVTATTTVMATTTVTATTTTTTLPSTTAPPIPTWTLPSTSGGFGKG